MRISVYGLLFAVLFLGAALAQWAFLKSMLARGLAAERESLPAAELAARAAGHEKLLKVLFWIDVLVLPPIGYYVGLLVFGT